MLKEIYFVNENDQFEINFDSLEFKTSKHFVFRIQKHLSMVKSSKIVNVIDGSCDDMTYIRVYLKDRNILNIFEYYRSGIEESVTKSFYSDRELNMMKQLMEDDSSEN